MSEAKATAGSRRSFRLKLFDARKRLKDVESLRFYDLRTVIYTGPEYKDSFDLIARAIGLTINYGTLMAYLFRRFGYPNAGWDNYKELACYQLSTPEPDMYMRITPFVGDTSSISIMFMIAGERRRAIDDYERQPGKAHDARMFAWLESTVGLPEWADQCLVAIRRDWGNGIESFQAALPYLELYRHSRYTGSGDGDSREGVVPSAWVTWAKEKRAAFEAMDPRPGVFLRSERIEDWPDEDPLKRYALAAVAALSDLKTAVRVRDSAINAFGYVYNARTAVLKEPAVAGYPSGAIGNAAPKEFAELHRLIMKFGNGDAKRGITKVLKALGHPDHAEVRT